MTTLLALDCSCDICSIALAHEGEALSRESQTPRRHADEILGMVMALLQSRSLNIADLDAIALTVGPGSFTGLRIGSAVAQGLAFGHEIPLIPFSSLATIAIAAGNLHGADRVLTVLQARENEVYFAAWERRDQTVQNVIPEQVLSAERLQQQLQQLEGEWFAAGDGWTDALQTELAARLSGCDPEIQARAVHLLAPAAKRLAAGDCVGLEEAVPVYLKEQLDYRQTP